MRSSAVVCGCEVSAGISVSSCSPGEMYLEEKIPSFGNGSTQLVDAHHVTAFEMLMYGVFSDWMLCRKENPP